LRKSWRWRETALKVERPAVKKSASAITDLKRFGVMFKAVRFWIYQDANDAMMNSKQYDQFDPYSNIVTWSGINYSLLGPLAGKIELWR